jgi:hypothetical protein
MGSGGFGHRWFLDGWLINGWIRQWNRDWRHDVKGDRFSRPNKLVAGGVDGTVVKNLEGAKACRIE